MNLTNETEKLKSKGYTEDDANARICQDIILKGIAESGLSHSVTIKGGVVMRNISHNDRRATQDADFDFIKYSISDDSIIDFLKKIETAVNVEIEIKQPILVLKHKDYQGKRVFITIRDIYGNELISKLDIGVHKDLDIKQDEYCFDICFQENGVSLLMNSKEQILTEKLKSFLRFGTRSTRYKDIFDICFLSDIVDIEKLKICIQQYIFNDESLHVFTYDDIAKRIERVFTNSTFKKNVEKSEKNWLNNTNEEAFKKNIKFIKSLHQ